jgi:hypothetical protein
MTTLIKKPRAWRVIIVNILVLAVILVVVAVVAGMALKTPPIQNVSGALTMLSTFAQVSSTIAGFLIVGLIFLIQSRRSTKGEPLVLLRLYDIIFFGLAILAFSYATINATDGMRYVASKSQVDALTTDYLRWTAVSLWAGYMLALVGFCGLIMNYKDRIKEIRLR